MAAASAIAAAAKGEPNVGATINRRGAKRTVPMKCLGMGTLSLRTALIKLGFIETHHMSSNLENPPDSILWKEALDAKYHGVGKPWTTTEEWDQLLGHCMATTDAPSCYFAAELIAAYPHAKVVLTTRDVDKWFESVDTVIVSAFMRSPFIRWLAPWDPAFFGIWLPMAESLFYGAMGSSVADWEAHGRDTYRDYHALVKSLVPPERLLEYRVGEGWERLCAFLEVPVPDEPFPRVNESAEAQRLLGLLLRNALFRALFNRRTLFYAGVVAVAAVGVKQYLF